MNLDLELDILGCQPALFRLYTQMVFIFQNTDTTSHTELVSILNRGLGQLSQNFPWVAAQVVNTNADEKGAPMYRIRHSKAAPSLTVKDYTKDAAFPTLAQMVDAGFPMSMLGEEVWAPCPTLSIPGLETSKSLETLEQAPVMLTQISFIRGGTVLCINMQHNVCDMMGQAAVMAWLSKACRGQEFSREERIAGNPNRANVILADDSDDYLAQGALEHQLFPPQALPVQIQASTIEPRVEHRIDPLDCSWSYFHFTASSLRSLKDVASACLPSGFHGYISTDDTLSAFIFQSVLRVRQYRLRPERSITLARAVDARRYVGVPVSYPGILQNMTYTSYPLAALINTPLGNVAAAMRQQVDPTTSDIAWRTRALVAFLSESPDNQARVSATASLKMDADIALSSWTKVQPYNWDFGLGLGSPVAVRRPGFIPVESLIYLMPKDMNGTIAVAACLRREDLVSLREDRGWSQYAVYIG